VKPYGTERSEEESAAGYGHERSGASGVMEFVVEATNLRAAMKRVEGNKGSPGVDGMTTGELRAHLREHWPRIRQSLLEGKYRPQPVRRVEIAKPDGGVRELGIPTVVDRFIQQAMLQVLQLRIDGKFSEHSYGFRPGRSAQQAVRQAKQYVQGGRPIVVDVDLAKFFDRVNHDVLMSRVARHVDDKRALVLIRRYLNAGVMMHGVVTERHEGTPQGGPLSPLLANILLDEVDKELERRGHAFVRYADDLNVYVRSRRAGERVMATLRRLFNGLHLQINEGKSATDEATKRTFLGFSFWSRKGKVKLRLASSTVERLKKCVRAMTGRTCGRSIEQTIATLSRYLRGWSGYFDIVEARSVLTVLDGWIRHRLRAVWLKQSKTAGATYRNLIALGANPATAETIASSSLGWWRRAETVANAGLTNRYFDHLGVVSRVVWK
jgi:group II intron reverse transcriptase/maturase